jgi:hypothetical protein
LTGNSELFERCLAVSASGEEEHIPVVVPHDGGWGPRREVGGCVVMEETTWSVGGRVDAQKQLPKKMPSMERSRMNRVQDILKWKNQSPRKKRKKMSWNKGVEMMMVSSSCMFTICPIVSLRPRHTDCSG